MEQHPLTGVSDRLVSSHLFRNKLVREFVLQNGFNGVYSYCGDMTKVIPLKMVVEKIDSIILKYYGDPDNEGTLVLKTMHLDITQKEVVILFPTISLIMMICINSFSKQGLMLTMINWNRI